MQCHPHFSPPVFSRGPWDLKSWLPLQPATSFFTSFALWYCQKLHWLLFSATFCLASQLPLEPHRMPKIGINAEKESIIMNSSLWNLGSSSSICLGNTHAFKQNFLVWIFYSTFLQNSLYLLQTHQSYNFVIAFLKSVL